MPSRLLFGVRGHSKQPSAELRLAGTRPFFPPLPLPLPHHGQHFVPLQRAPGSAERPAAQTGFDEALDEALLVFHAVVAVVHWSQVAGVRHGPGAFEVGERFGKGGVFVAGDHARSEGGCGFQRLVKKRLGGLSGAGGTEQALQRLASRVYRSVQLPPRALHLHLRLVDPPRVVRGFQMGSAAPLQVGGVALHPPRDRGVVTRHPSFQQQRFEITRAQRVAHGPAHAEQNDLSFVMPPREGTRLAHLGTPPLARMPNSLPPRRHFLQQSRPGQGTSVRPSPRRMRGRHRQTRTHRWIRPQCWSAGPGWA